MADKYDDLDDLLDDFDAEDPDVGHLTLQDTPGLPVDSVPAATARNPEPTPTESSHKTTEKTAPALSSIPGPKQDEEIAQKLQQGMEELMREMDDDPEARRVFEQVMGQLDPGADDGSKSGTKAAPKFEDAISATMDRLQEHKQPAEDSDAFLEQMLKELQSAAGAGPGAADGLLDGLMLELTSKEILYEPIKELDDKYPQWFEDNEKKISASDLKRYKQQHSVISAMVAKFESPSYSDANPADREHVAKLMSEMQESGAPPDSLAPELATGGGASGCDLQ